MFVVITMKKKNLLLLELNYAIEKPHFWRPWRGCSMIAFLQREEGLHDINMTMKVVLKIQVLRLIFLAAFRVTIEEEDVLVVMVSVEEELLGVVLAVMCDLMKMVFILATMMMNMIMRILLQTMGGLGSTMVVVEVLVVIMIIIVVIIIGKIKIALLVSS